MTLSRVLLVFSFAFLLIFLPEEVLARAGGGSSTSTNNGGGILGYIIGGIFSSIMAVIVYQKNKKCNELIEKLSKVDVAWDPHALKARIELTYFNVQESWKQRNNELAKEHMSQGLYRKHKFKIERMIEDGHKPMMFAIKLNQATIVEVTDFEDDSKDRLCALIEGSMIDYMIDEKTKEHISGVAEDQTFKEFWKFVREGDNWVLDEIDQTATSRELIKMVASSEVV